MIAIIDYDVGNIKSVANMLQRLGLKSVMTNDPALVAEANHIILPGNGSFDACMRNLRSTGLIPVLENRVLKQGAPLLGICVGAQILGFQSEEGVEAGLGWLKMKVERIPSSASFPVPHMGWSNVLRVNQIHPLTIALDVDTRFYFAHSYHMVPEQAEDVLLKSSYGIELVAGVARGNVIGVQFHPEKSHRFGKQLLSAFAGLN